MTGKRTPAKGWNRLLIAITLFAGMLVPHSAQAQSEHSLLKSDLVRMMTGNSYSAEEVLQIVRMNCVAFAPSDRDRNDLARLFDGDELLDEIDRCRKVGHADGYRHGVPVARTATAVALPEAPQTEGPRIESPDLTEPSFTPPELARPTLLESHATHTLPGVEPSAPPRLLNWDYVTHRILSEYRPDRRHSGKVLLKIWVDPEGSASDATILDADGDPALARVALAVVPLMRFAPAESRDRKVGAWATLPIQFQAD
ncbi:MAG: TonB family protein [Gemmatimonadota bacterium]